MRRFESDARGDRKRFIYLFWPNLRNTILLTFGMISIIIRGLLCTKQSLKVYCQGNAQATTHQKCTASIQDVENETMPGIYESDAYHPYLHTWMYTQSGNSTKTASSHSITWQYYEMYVLYWSVWKRTQCWMVEVVFFRFFFHFFVFVYVT